MQPPAISAVCNLLDWFRSQSQTVELHGVDAASIDPQAIAKKFPELADLLSSITLISE